MIKLHNPLIGGAKETGAGVGRPVPRVLLLGTVTQAEPLRIRLDGDSEPLPYAPKRLGGYAAPEVDDRVLLASMGGRLVVLGKVI